MQSEWDFVTGGCEWVGWCIGHGLTQITPVFNCMKDKFINIMKKVLVVSE